MTERTIRLATDMADRVTVVTSDEDAAQLADNLGAEVIPDPDDGLSAAATAGLAHGMGPWLVVHADLPLLTADDLADVTLVTPEGVIVPSPDGGTTIIGGVDREFAFDYGPASFRRHLGAMPHARIVTRIGASLDIDSPEDLAAAMSHDRGGWLLEIVAVRSDPRLLRGSGDDLRRAPPEANYSA